MHGVWDPSTGLGSINRTILQNERSYCKLGANCKICQPSQVVVLSLHEQEQWLHVGQKAAAGKRDDKYFTLAFQHDQVKLNKWPSMMSML